MHARGNLHGSHGLGLCNGRLDVGDPYWYAVRLRERPGGVGAELSETPAGRPGKSQGEEGVPDLLYRRLPFGYFFMNYFYNLKKGF